MKLFARLRAHARRLHEEQESGVAMTEFAIAFPLQFFMTLAIMQFSLILVGHVLAQQAAFAAARASLVADVPTTDGTSVSDNIDTNAKKAALYILMPICPTNNDFHAMSPGAPTPTQGTVITFAGNDDRSNAAYALTTVNTHNTTATDNYVSAEIFFDMPLEIPVVNHWFAKLGAGGTPGGFMYGPSNGNFTGYNDVSNQHGFTCLRLHHVAFLPRPWRAQ